MVRKWISRFQVWPYLETYTEDVAHELAKELQDKPDLIIGNYSDGNIVASLLAHKLGVTQCTIAHALEKTKYLVSNIYWKKFEEKYYFSCQFTAILFAMNHNDQYLPRDCSKPPRITTNPIVEENRVIKQNKGWRRNRVYTLVVLKGGVDDVASVEKKLDEGEV
ncbi:sucrose synthase [Senna tora]|uniref:sucrose synthase n=1 Tax=Senna tora TaxID=362788 RepID=A0A834XIR0_9FABA|nr:sucrose synthase [Senna tora]